MDFESKDFSSATVMDKSKFALSGESKESLAGCGIDSKWLKLGC